MNIFFKWAILGLFYRLFSVFSSKHYNWYNNKFEKCPSSIGYRDSNPQSLDRGSPPITTRPVSCPYQRLYCINDVPHFAKASYICERILFCLRLRRAPEPIPE